MAPMQRVGNVVLLFPQKWPWKNILLIYIYYSAYQCHVKIPFFLYNVSSYVLAAGLSVAINTVLLFPPRLSWKIGKSNLLNLLNCTPVFCVLKIPFLIQKKINYYILRRDGKRVIFSLLFFTFTLSKKKKNK